MLKSPIDLLTFVLTNFYWKPGSPIGLIKNDINLNFSSSFEGWKMRKNTWLGGQNE